MRVIRGVGPGGALAEGSEEGRIGMTEASASSLWDIRVHGGNSCDTSSLLGFVSTSHEPAL